MDTKDTKKPIKCGYKIWCCCCACCGYLCTLQVYQGCPRHPLTGAKVPEKGIVMRVVKEIVLADKTGTATLTIWEKDTDERQNMWHSRTWKSLNSALHVTAISPMIQMMTTS